MQTADHALTKEFISFDIFFVTEKVEQRNVSSVAVESRNFHIPCKVGLNKSATIEVTIISHLFNRFLLVCELS